MTSQINRVHPLTMANMSAKFDKETCNGVVSIVFTRSTYGRTEPRTHGNTAALLYPHRNALRGDNQNCSEKNMSSTVNKRRVVYILAKRVRSQALSLKFLCILLNKGYNMPNNTKNLR